MGQIPVEAMVLVDDRWIIVGEQSQNSLIVRGGQKPFSMRVECSDSTELRRLVECANRGRLIDRQEQRPITRPPIYENGWQ